MPAVESSMLREIDHDGARRLSVTFVSGERYVYEGVDAELYQELLAAPSKGTFFNDHIRGAFPYARLTARRGRGR